MADLVSIAQRLNDVEINNNAPVSSQTFRRVGSDINYLLDLVGANNGDTNPTGPLGTILRDVATVTYSYTVLNSPIGVDTTIFTFVGGGDRPFAFFKRSSNLEIAGSGPFEFKPIFEMLSALAAPVTTISSLGVVYEVKINSILVGTVGRNTGGTSPLNVLSYSREIHLAPSGTNTVTIRRLQVTSATPTVSSSFEYVAL